MKRDIVLIIDGRKCDMRQDTALTLNFNSSLLSDISSIRCNGSQTIKLPRTVNNDSIFDLALQPSHDSTMTHRMLSCSCYIDGITVFDNGRCHLLDSSAEEYEVAVTWGVMHEFSTWLEEKPKLRDLAIKPEDSVPWNANSGVGDSGGPTSIVNSYNGNTHSMFFMDYDCGVDLVTTSKQYCNIHPSVTLLEIWDRITTENGLRFNLDAERPDMERMMIVLENHNTSLQTMTRKVVVNERPSVMLPDGDGDTKQLYLNSYSEFFNNETSSFVHAGEHDVTIAFTSIFLRMPAGQGDGSDGFKAAVMASREDYAMVIKPYRQQPVVVLPSDTLYSDTIEYKVNQSFVVTGYEGTDSNGLDLLDVRINIKRWDGIPNLIWENPSKNLIQIGAQGVDISQFGDWETSFAQGFRFSQGDPAMLSTIDFSYEGSSNDYPLASFTLVENLPDITQLDFVKFICAYYGLFPVQRGNTIDFVRFNVLTDNIEAGIYEDWSSKLIQVSDDAPAAIAFSLDGYAQSNVMTYKLDENDAVEMSAALVVNDETLEDERIFAEFPFAASRGNRIPQYTLNEEGDGVEKNDLEYRIMRADWQEMSLSFTDSMAPRQILNRHYSELQQTIRTPKTIEEDVMLNELDLKTLDYTRPIYLAKYGRYFAVMSIQWSSDKAVSKVKLLLIK